MMKKLEKVRWVSKTLDTTDARVYQMSREGLLPVVVFGQRQYRWDPLAIQKWIENGGNQKPKKGGKKDV